MVPAKVLTRRSLATGGPAVAPRPGRPAPLPVGPVVRRRDRARARRRLLVGGATKASTGSTGSTAQASTPSTNASSAASTDGSIAPDSALRPGAPLPSDAACAALVRPAAETRPDNAKFNATRGVQKNLTGPYPLFSRVDGNFTGTTDEIIQWTACKWGVDPDIVRAQAVVESYWHQQALGDTTSNASVCAPNHPIGSDPSHPGMCPESVGLLQVRFQYWPNGFNEGGDLDGLQRRLRLRPGVPATRDRRRG